MNRWVLSLRDIAAEDADLVGGKAWQLARLVRGGLPVSEAFVVTRNAFAEHFPRAVPGRLPPAPELSPALIGAVREALTAQLASESWLAVRSSALGEDGGEASYAGQHDTYYFVPPEGVPQAICDCWMSLWSAPARQYRALRDSTGPFAMAVIVQRMIPADRAGVCFTDDPTGAFPGQAWIEATWGLGAALVDGRVSPDRLLLDRQGRVLRRHTGRKRHRIPTTPGRHDSRLEPVPAFLQSAPVLSDAEAGEILSLARRAEALAGAPQDVEWACQGPILYLLQSRPITGVADRRGPAPPPGRWVLFKPLAENFSEPLTPMSEDLYRQVLPPMGMFHQGHYYLNFDLAARYCPVRWSERELADAMLLRGSVPPLAWRWARLPGALLAAAIAYLLDGISWHRTAHLTAPGLAVFEGLCAHLRARSDVEALPALRRLISGRHPLEPIGRRAFYVNVSAGRYFLLLGVLKKLLARWAPQLDPDVPDRLCSPSGGTYSRHLVEAVGRLAELARADPTLRRRLLARDPEDVSAALASLDHGHPFSAGLETLLQDYGHRCVREMELASPRWREDPLPLVLMVRGYLRSDPAHPGDPEMTRLLAATELRKALPGRWRHRLVSWLVRRIRYYVGLRENSRHFHTMAMDVARNKLLELEQHLIAEGRLRLGGDVFFLTWQETRDLRAGRLSAREASTRIRQRRRERRARSRSAAPATLGMSWPESPDGEHHDDALFGQCASPGTAEGRVRIVLDPASAHDIEPGDILVAPYTDPAWTPLFPLVGAVVVEVGSFLSHAGTVAREYGIPCMVDVAGCTSRLREGQRIRVLASDGRLEILK